MTKTANTTFKFHFCELQVYVLGSPTQKFFFCKYYVILTIDTYVEEYPMQMFEAAECKEQVLVYILRLVISTFVLHGGLN